MADHRRVSDLGIVGLRVSPVHLVGCTRHDRAIPQPANAALVLHVEEARDVAVVREELVVDFDAPKN